MSNTKEQIVSLSRDLIQRIGYQSFSFRMIADQLDIKNAAIHYHFPGKENLGVAVIEKDSADFIALTDSLADKSPSMKIEAILGLYDHYFNDGNKLCLIGACGAGYMELPLNMQAAAKAHLMTISSWLTDVFSEGLGNGEFRFPVSAAAMAAQWVNALPGTLITGRILGKEHVDQGLGNLRKSLQIN